MSTLTELAREYARKYPTPGSGERSWDQMCGSLMYRMLDTYGVPPTGDIRSAYIVFERTRIDGRNPVSAPAGAFHFWSIGGRYNGHVALDLTGGGTRLFMASTHLHTALGAAIGYSDVSQYSNATGARYLGWSRNYANGGALRFNNGTPARRGAVTSRPATVKGVTILTWHFMTPSTWYQKEVQKYLKKRGRYSGPVDGKFGLESIKGLQRTVTNVGYSGLIDGVPGPMLCYYMQVYARKFGGYKGPLDKVMGNQTWVGFRKGIKT